MTKTIDGNTEISLEAVKIFVDEVFSDTHKIVEDKTTGLRAIISTSSAVTGIVYHFSYQEEDGFSILDQNGENITTLAKVICFTDDVKENGNYVVIGITNGTLTITGRDAITYGDIERLVEIEKTL